MKLNKGVVYILQCADDKYYTGSTNQLDRRIREHNRGKCHTTKMRLPVKLVFTLELDTLLTARKIERFIKKQKSRKYIDKIIKGKIDLALSSIG